MRDFQKDGSGSQSGQKRKTGGLSGHFRRSRKEKQHGKDNHDSGNDVKCREKSYDCRTLQNI